MRRASAVVADASAIVLERIQSEECGIALALAVALAACSALMLVANRRVRAVLAFAVLAALYYQTGWILRDYNPTVDDRFVFPRTAAVEALESSLGGRRLLTLGEGGLPPDTNLVYGIATPQSYDALDILRYSHLLTLQCDAFDPWQNVRRVRPKTLELFGIGHVLACGEWLPVETELGEHFPSWRAFYEPLSLERGAAVEQTFRCDRDGLSAVAVWVGIRADDELPSSALRLLLFDAESAEQVAERELSAESLRRAAFEPEDYARSWNPFDADFRWNGAHAIARFAAIPRSQGRSYRLRLEATSGTGEHFLWTTRNLALPGATLRCGDAVLAGTLLFDFECESGRFEPLARIERSTLHRDRQALGPYFAVSRSIWSACASYSLDLVRDPDFDPYRAVVLESRPEREYPLRAALPQIPLRMERFTPATAAEVVARSANGLALRVERPEPGFLVACQAFYPGWTARVNGEDAPVLCANYAFCAVPIPAGTSTVELSFAPSSFAAGAWLALASALLGALILLLVLRKRAAEPSS